YSHRDAPAAWFRLRVLEACPASSANTTHDAAPAAYTFHLDFQVGWGFSPGISPGRNMRSHSTRMIGSVTADSFEAAASTAQTAVSPVQRIPGRSAARVAEYSASRKKSPSISSVRWLT